VKIKTLKKPRLFTVNDMSIKDYGKIQLNKNEMISFITKSKREYDFTAKDWGFYVTPSINGRLKKEGFKIALVKNNTGKFFIMAVENNKKILFKKYCSNDMLKIIKWMS